MIRALAFRQDPKNLRLVDWASLFLVLIAWVPLLHSYGGSPGSALESKLAMRSATGPSALMDPGLEMHLSYFAIFGWAIATSRLLLTSGKSRGILLLTVLLAVPLVVIEDSRHHWLFASLPAVFVLLQPSAPVTSERSRRFLALALIVIVISVAVFQGAVRSQGLLATAEEGVPA